MPASRSQFASSCTRYAYAQTQLSGSLPAVLTDAPQRGFMLKIIGAVIPLMNFFASRVDGLAETSTGSSNRRSASPESHRLPALPKRAGSVYASRFASNMFDILGEAHIQHTVCSSRISVSTARQSKFSSFMYSADVRSWRPQCPGFR